MLIVSGVRHRAGQQAGAHQSRAARGGPARRPRRGRRRAARSAAVARLRGRRSSGCARLRGRSTTTSRRCATLLGALDGIDEVWGEDGKALLRARPRSARASSSRSRDPDAWFTYYYWLDDARAPDFARTVEIHRKPGYDPVELFLDPDIAFPKLAVGWRLSKRALGLRALMDVIPLDASLVRGSHGRADTSYARGPVIMSSEAGLLPEGTIDAGAT